MWLVSGSALVSSSTDTSNAASVLPVPRAQALSAPLKLDSAAMTLAPPAMLAPSPTVAVASVTPEVLPASHSMPPALPLPGSMAIQPSVSDT